MTILEEFFSAFLLHSPLPFLLLLYFFYYRHDLGRIRWPFRENKSKETWWHVCSYLGLIPPDVPKPGRVEGKKSYIISISVSALVSLLWLFRPFNGSVLSLLLIQEISSIILFVGVVARFLGSRPRRPYADALRYPRLGSRVRHLFDVEGRPHPQFEPEPAEARWNENL